MSVVTTDKKWFDDLVVELRLRQVHGVAIGDTVASARELLADTGQRAEEAFGPARDYAESLELPRERPDEVVKAALWLSLVGLFGFLLFVQTATSWAQGEPFLLSPAQLGFVLLPVTLGALLPFYINAAIRRRWPLVLVVVVCTAAGALSAITTPESAADAWLVLDPIPLTIVSALAMVVASVASSIRTRRRGAIDDVVDPLAGPPARRSMSTRAFAILTDWLFPVVALFFLAPILLLTQ